MSFDVHVDLEVTLAASARQSFPARAEIRMISNETDNIGRWRLVGRQDGRLPVFGDAWHEWRRDVRDPLAVHLMLGPHKVFARLLGFEKGMRPTSKAILYASGLPMGPPPYSMPNAPGWFVGEWSVNHKARHGNMPTAVMDDGFVAQCLALCSRDTGFRYDTSAGVGFSGGAGAGAGVTSSRLVLKRKEETDKRRWDIAYKAFGFGLTTPSIGVTGATEATPSGAVSNVMAGVNMRQPFTVADLAGSMVAFEAGAGASIGKGKAGGGVGGSTTTFLFFGGVYNEGTLPDITTLKCGFQVWSSAGSASRGGTSWASAGMSGFLWVGVATSVTERRS